MANWLTDLFEQKTPPGQLIVHRKRYGEYVSDSQTNGRESLPFEAWLITQGVDPASLGLQTPGQRPVSLK